MKKIIFCLLTLVFNLLYTQQVITLIDSNTKENVNFQTISALPPGATVDNIVYASRGGILYKRVFNELNPVWFGAIPDDGKDDSDAFQKCVDVAKRLKGVSVKIPFGHYNFRKKLVIEGVKNFGFYGSGQQMIYAKGDKANASCVLDFDNCTDDVAIECTNFVGVDFHDFYLSFNRTGKAGTGFYLWNGHLYKVSGLMVDVSGSPDSKGILLGGGRAENCAFMGEVDANKVLGDGCIGIATMGGNTSLSFRNNYLGGTFFWIEGTIYSTFISNAVDSNVDKSYYVTGNIYNNSTNLTFISCGAEGATGSAFYIDNYAQNIDLLNPYTTASNSSGRADRGSLLTIDGKTFVKNIRVTNPTAIASKGWAVYGSGTFDNVTLENTNKKLLQGGIGGNNEKFDVTGDYEWQKFTPTIVGVTGDFTTDFFFKKVGRQVFIRGTIKPNGNINITFGRSVISLPLWAGYEGSLSQFNNAYTTGNALKISGDNVYMQSAGDTSLPVRFVGVINNISDDYIL